MATATLTPTSPIWTPQPTLPADEAKLYILDLLQNNGGCQLPCWWGITPGQTTWLEAQAFLQRFAIDISIKDIEENVRIAYVQIPSPFDVPYITYLNQEYGIRNGIVETIQTYNYDITNEYNLPNVLQKYGQVDEVGISTAKYSDNPNNRPFSISLFYISKGILIEYVGYKKVSGAGNVELEDDKIRACPQGGTYNFLYIWSPNLELDFDKAAKKFLDIENQPFPIRLKEATGMDVKTFYETFRDPNTTICLETPKQLWPEY
jgi:hypothetical protein